MAAEPRTTDRILIVRLSALGDVVHVLPLLDALRRARPSAHIGWLVEEGAASLLTGHPQIDRVWIVPRREAAALARAGHPLAALRRFWRVLRELRAARYDLTIDAQCNLRSSLLARASGAPRRIGFAPPFTKEGGHWWSTERVALPPGKRLKVERNLELLRPLGIEPRGVGAVVPVTEEIRCRARESLAPIRTGALVALHPGVSGSGAIKRWDPERFAALARRLSERQGTRCIVSWGPGERELAERVVQASDGAAQLMPETRSLLDLAALYECCDAVVGADTGPVHLAAVLGVPVVALYGPKDPAIYAPWDVRTGRAARSLWKGVHCSPCNLRRCGELICMPAIGVDDVTDEVREVLSSEDLRVQAVNST